MSERPHSTPPITPRQPDPRRLRMVAVVCVAFVMAMVGAAYAAVPLYRIFCAATGYGGTPQRVEAASNVISDKTIRVRFDANVDSSLNWEFKPEQREMEVKLGQTNIAFFKARNLSDKPTWGQAVYNVTPEVTGSYFNKIQCFCFTEQRLEPNEALDMPVQFYVDPDILKDADARNVPTITLSYTFYAAKAPTPVAANVADKSKL